MQYFLQMESDSVIMSHRKVNSRKAVTQMLGKRLLSSDIDRNGASPTESAAWERR